MPNHISNRVQFTSNIENYKRADEALEQLKLLMKTDDHPFDFNVLFPYPKEWDEADDKYHAAQDALMARVNAAGDDMEKRKEIMLEYKDLPPDGYNHGGYEWCIATWGTKWNAYDIGFDYDAILFQTAWTTPAPIWAEISKRFPDLELVVEYASEDRGSNCGVLKYLAGKLTEQTLYGINGPTPHSKLFARAIIAEQGEAHACRELKLLENAGQGARDT